MSTVSCPHCGRALTTTQQAAGKQVVCPICRRQFTVASSQDLIPAPPRVVSPDFRPAVEVRVKRNLRKKPDFVDTMKASFQRYRAQCGNRSLIFQSSFLGWTLLMLIIWMGTLTNPSKQATEQSTIAVLLMYIMIAVPLAIVAIVTRKPSDGRKSQSTTHTPPSRGFAVGRASIEGVQVDVLSDEMGRKWCNYPRPFRLWEEVNDWLLQHGAYMFDESHYVIDDPNSSECMYVQLTPTQDGRYTVSFLTHRDHWPRNVPVFAKRLLSAREQSAVAAQHAAARQRQNAQLAAGLGLAALAMALTRR